jgi:integrase
LLTGCRKSEALAVKWSDVDYKIKQVHISGTKTENAVRFIPLFPQLEKLLADIPKIDEYIFPYTDNLVHCNFVRLKRKYNLTFRIHDLRHTFATRCLENKISINTVQRWLGYAQASTTANIYFHILTAFEFEEIKKFDPKI